MSVNIVSPNGGPGDPILYQGLKLLEAGLATDGNRRAG
jgi:hypothetical protein